MEFRQPNSLARAMHQVLDQLLRGQTVTLSFATEAELRHALEVLNEVARDRQVAIVATTTGGRVIENYRSPPRPPEGAPGRPAGEDQTGLVLRARQSGQIRRDVVP